MQAVSSPTRWRPAPVLGMLLTLAIIAADPAFGQNSWDYSWGYSTNLRYFSNKQVLKRKKGQRPARRGTTSTRRSATGRTAKPVARTASTPPYSKHTAFKPVGDRNFRLWSVAAEATKGRDWGYGSIVETSRRQKEAIDELKARMARLLDEFAGQARAEGKQPYDVAYGLGRSIGMNYAVATGKPVTASEQAALVAQSRSKLLADARFREMGDEGRQKIYEGALLPSLMARSTSDRELARQNISALLGREPEQVRLTAQGVAAR